LAKELVLTLISQVPASGLVFQYGRVDCPTSPYTTVLNSFPSANLDYTGRKAPTSLSYTDREAATSLNNTDREAATRLNYIGGEAATRLICIDGEAATPPASAIKTGRMPPA
jgi:hypothetical protein